MALMPVSGDNQGWKTCVQVYNPAGFSMEFAAARRSSKYCARPDGKLLILNNPLDQSELVDCGLSMRPITAVESPFMLQNVGTYQ